VDVKDDGLGGRGGGGGRNVVDIAADLLGSGGNVQGRGLHGGGRGGGD